MISLVALTLAANLVAMPNPADFKDSDNDGLLDKWETEGFGPIDPKTMGCKPNHADIFIVFRIRSGMTQAIIQPTLDRMKKFYAAMPYKNLDGTTGLNMIAIVPPAMPKETDGKGYIELYEQAMPTEWRGLAHGILVDNSGGGGGQANRSDWAGTGYNWPTMLHELGHQLGLPHDPLGARIGSPFHRSMMNYDYSYQLGGKGEDIIFSDGKFKKMTMKENALDENVPYSVAEIDFLNKHPYYFKIKAIDATHSSIDWNRNGIFGEKNVRANVNDGYSINLIGGFQAERSAGAPVLGVLGKSLIAVLPDLADYKDWGLKSLTREKPGRLSVQLLDTKANKGEKPLVIVNDGVCGDASVATFKDELWIAYPTTDGFRSLSLRASNKNMATGAAKEVKVGKVEPTLVATPTEVLALTWDSVTSAVSVGSLKNFAEDSQVLPGLTSQQPVGAVWNSKRNCLAVATVVHQANFDGCIKITHFKSEKGKWVAGDFIWVGNDKGGARTSGRPILIFDESKDRGPMGAYNVYVKGQYPDASQAGINFCCRQVAEGEGWRIKMMGNEWAFSRSVCAAVPFNGDIAYAYRWNGGGNDNRTMVTVRASGIEDEFLTDFDEVTYIFEHGLKNSLREVQNEQWRKRR